MIQTLLAVEDDYAVPLLKLLADLPGGEGRRQEVLERFFSLYQDRIPLSERELLSSGQGYRWAKKISWCRQRLVDQRLMDMPTRGIWRITQAGRDWLARNPHATRINTERNPGGTKKSKPPGGGPIIHKYIESPPGITMEMLEQTKKVMPPGEFQQIWGAIYDQLLANERAKAITPFTDKDLLAAVRQPVRRIQEFLQGKGNEVPKSEDVCDWIHFCYTLSLYREAAALWQYVHQDEVNPWMYKRTEKLAVVCRARVGA